MRPGAEDPRGAVLLVGLAVFGLMAGQQMVNPVLPPLAREFGFSELALGVVWAVSGFGVALASPFWGRRGLSWGHRRVLLISLIAATTALLAFATVAHLGLTGVLAGPVLFASVMASRGVVFGLAWAATPVTAQSYVANSTSGTRARVRGMSMLGAAQGIALAVGPALGGALSLAGLVVPLYAAPALVAVVAVVIGIGLPRARTPQAQRPVEHVSTFDPRVWPFLTTGFVMYLALAVVLTSAGFLLQDRLQLTAQQTGPVTSLILLAGAGTIVAIQAVAVPRLGWTPTRLIRVGAVLMTVGMAGVSLAPTGTLIAVAVAVLGAGMGFGIPGFMAAPTLLVSRAEQGAVAGLVGSTSALAFALGPLLGTGLYEIYPAAPYLLGALLLAGLTIFAFVHRGLQQSTAVAAQALVDVPISPESVAPRST